MSRGNRRELASRVGAGLIVAVLVGWSVVTSLQIEDGRAQQREQRTQDEDRRAAVALLDDPREQAIATETRARRQAERERRDLDAQRSMANWAIVQGVVGVLGLIGLGFTVFFAGGAWHAAKKSAQADFLALKNARVQLQEARKAADETFKITKRQSRAYVRAIGASYDPPAGIPAHERAALFPQGRVWIRLDNFGQTAAKGVVIRCELVPAKIGEFTYSDPLQYKTRPTTLAPKEDYSDWFKAPEGAFVGGADELGGKDFCMLRGEVRYSDVFGGRFSSQFVFVLFRGLLKSIETKHDFNISNLNHNSLVFEEVEIDPNKGD